MRLTACLLTALLAFACAAKSKPAAPALPVPSLDLRPADALFDAGCYVCLQQAFEMYDRSLQSASPAPHARDRVFVTALLLAAREKELGLAATPWLDRAAAMATAAERVYLEIVTSLEWTSIRVPDFEAPRTAGGARAAWLSLLDQPPSQNTIETTASRRHPILDQYLLVALACLEGGRRVSDIQPRIDLSRPATRYRLGLCGSAQRPHLEAVLGADPRFIEASFFIGRYEMASGVLAMGGGGANRRWLSTSVPPLLAAHDGLPKVPIITIVFASLMRSRTELGRALTLYDEALALRPLQRDALLGRTITLTYLTRRDEAIASATRMIELGTWYVGDAYYWRAFNRYQLTQLDLAAADVVSARRLQINDDVMTLSGLIAYDQHRPVDARRDFASAIELNRDRCTAHWYFGILDLDESAWANAVPRFSTAGECFQRTADAVRAEATQLPDDLPEDIRQQQLAGFADSIDSSLRQAGRAFLNAAQASLRLGQKTQALDYARTATRYDEVKVRADSLVQSLEAPSPRE